MKTFILFFSFVLFAVGISSAQGRVSMNTLPVPTGVTPTNDPSIPNIVWNRFKTKNFTILSINAEQGQMLNDNIEQMKSWTLTRWGFPDVDFKDADGKDHECRIFAAPDVETMKKLFNIDNSSVDIQYENNKIKISYIWLILSGKPSEDVPPAISIVSFKELEQKHGKVDWWMHRGTSLLNGTIPQIRFTLVQLKPVLKNDQSIFFSKGLFSLTEEEWKKKTAEEKALFDREAAVMCLLLRKEHGQHGFLNVARASASESTIQTVYGFRDYAELDSAFKRYMFHLVDDIETNKTPDAYLQIKEIK